MVTPVYRHARHGTTVKWSSPLAGWVVRDSGMGAGQATIKGGKYKKAPEAGEARTPLIID
jgi:hypothetical protein